MNIELHLIQNFAPSCLNRDDMNMPKACTFGDVPRARLSSQCLKRAMREYMRASGLPTGIRTRRLAGVLDVLAGRGRDRSEAEARARQAMVAAGLGLEEGEPLRTKVALYLSDEEIAALADAIEADWDGLAPAEADGEAAKEAATGRKKKRAAAGGVEAPAVKDAFQRIGSRVTASDIALFGRMLAEKPTGNVDAACQVAHAISTHRVEAERDFFTAVDDLLTRRAGPDPGEDTEADTGAGMMGLQEFNSACFYRYMLIDRDQLVRNLHGDAALADRAIVAFVQAAVSALPTGRQNGSAAQNRPDYILCCVGDRLPCSLANAFEQPARPGNGQSLVDRSIDQLRQYRGRLARVYGEAPPDGCCEVSTRGDEGPSLDDLLTWLRGKLEGGE